MVARVISIASTLEERGERRDTDREKREEEEEEEEGEGREEGGRMAM